MNQGGLLHKPALAFGAVLLCAVAPVPVPAQEPGADKLEEIVVTARRREESLQSVPAAVTALTSQQLREQQIQNAADLQRVVSNTTMTDENTIIAGSLTAFIRGIGTDPGFQQGIGIYIDDMYLQSLLATDVAVYGNIDRIEVLKGPQGNLYGRNTIGGAIKYVTRDPGDDAQASVEVRTGRFSLGQATAEFSGPLVAGTLYGGVGVFWKQRDGFQTNLDTGQTLGSINQRAVHAVLKWVPADGVSIKLGGTYSLDLSHPRAPAFIGTLPAAAPFNSLPQMALIYDLLSANLPVPQLAPLESVIRPIAAANALGLNLPPPVFPALGPDQADTNIDYAQFVTETSSGYLTGQWAIDDRWTAKSATTYRTVRVKNNIDLDGLPEAYINTFQRIANADFTQEFQLNYSSERASGVAGLYYLNSHDGIPDSDTISPLVQLTQFTSEVQSESMETARSMAVYGNLDYNLTDTWHASFGARYTNERVGIVLRDVAVNTSLPLLSVAGQNVQFPIANSPLALYEAQLIAAASGGALAFVPSSTSTTVTDVNPTATFSSFTPTIKLGHDFGPRTLGYVGYAAGYKAGGFDTFRPFTQFHPEKVGSYSLGLKTTTPDDRLRWNTEAFYNDYTNKQLSTEILEGGSLGRVTRNAGQVHTYGVDSDLAWIPPIERLRLGLTAGYLKSKVVHFRQVNATGAEVDTAATTRLGFSPEFTAALDLNYRVPLGGAGDLTVDGNIYYRSRSYTDSPIDTTSVAASLEVQKANAISNASLTYRTPDEHFHLALEVLNLTDKRVLTNTFNAAVGSIIGQYNDPRTWSLSLGFDFH
jgi:iron complex outermembrane receptor protein